MTPAHPSPADIESVAALLPAFDFEGLITHGDSGWVFKARHLPLDRDVAIKIIPRGNSAGHSDIAGAKLMAGLNHPNLIRVYDSGEAGAFLYVVMEHVPGKSLEHSARGKAVEPKQACGIMIAACEGLANAHSCGVSHGRLTAANILLNPKCEPKIGNFGGPACAEGDSATRADVFELGLILRELLTGVPRDSADAARAIIPDMKLAMICRKATHTDPERRYPDAASLGEALSRAIMPADNTPPVKKPQPSPLHRPKPAPAAVGYGDPRGRLFGKCAAIAFLLFSICGVWAYSQAKQERITRLQKEEDAKPKVIIVRAAQPDNAPKTALVSWER